MKFEKNFSFPEKILPLKIHDPESLIYRKFIVSGEFMHDKEIFLYKAEEKTGKEGFVIFTPMITDDNRHIMVERGWIESKKKSISHRIDTLITGEVNIIGFLRTFRKSSPFLPENDIINNVWFYPDYNNMKIFTGMEIENYYLTQVGYHNDDDSLIKKTMPKINDQNDHLGYAITWFILAFAFFIISYLNYTK